MNINSLIIAHQIFKREAAIERKIAENDIKDTEYEFSIGKINAATYRKYMNNIRENYKMEIDILKRDLLSMT